jgi:hypothetical protein
VSHTPEPTHSPEPWWLWGGDIYTGTVTEQSAAFLQGSFSQILSPDEDLSDSYPGLAEVVAAAGEDDEELVEEWCAGIALLNAERAVACVNTCASLTTAQLEAIGQGGVAELFAALKALDAIFDFSEQWVPCACFKDVSDVNAAMFAAADLLDRLKIAEANAEGQKGCTE